MLLLLLEFSRIFDRFEGLHEAGGLLDGSYQRLRLRDCLNFFHVNAQIHTFLLRIRRHHILYKHVWRDRARRQGLHRWRVQQQLYRPCNDGIEGGGHGSLHLVTGRGHFALRHGLIPLRLLVAVDHLAETFLQSAQFLVREAELCQSWYKSF